MVIDVELSQRRPLTPLVAKQIIDSMLNTKNSFFYVFIYQTEHVCAWTGGHLAAG